MKVIEYQRRITISPIATRDACKTHVGYIMYGHSITTHLLSFTHAFTLRSTLYHALY